MKAFVDGRRWGALVLALALLGGCGLGARRGPSALGPGVYHVLRPGETLWALSRTYGVELEELLRANHIANPRELRAGVRIFIPRARQALYPPLSPPPPAGRERDRAAAPRGRPPVAREDGPRVEGPEFVWPVRGRISQYFSLDSGRRHDGIDIAVPEGTPVRAAEGGEVIFSDWGPGGYGRTVIVAHPGGFHTVYAHNRELLVRKGEKVARGQPIARSGQTGRATGPHLHFEIRRRTDPKDPLFFLP